MRHKEKLDLLLRLRDTRLRLSFLLEDTSRLTKVEREVLRHARTELNWPCVKLEREVANPRRSK